MLRAFFKKTAGVVNPNADSDKYAAEKNFWLREIQNYIKWYNGELDEYWGTKLPAENEKVPAQNIKDAAILTFQKFSCIINRHHN